MASKKSLPLILLSMTLVSRCQASKISAQNNLALVKEGKAKSVIVIAENPSKSAVAGAEILSEWLFEMSGARIPIRSEKKIEDINLKNNVSNQEKTYILVGESRFTKQLGCNVDKLGPGGFMIKSFPNKIVIMGADDKEPCDPWGTRYGCTYFLENLGCRYLWPGKLGMVTPPKSTIQISNMDIVKKPFLKWRQIRNLVCDRRFILGLKLFNLSGDEYRERYKDFGVDFNSSQDEIKAKQPQKIYDWFSWHNLSKLGWKSGHSYYHVWEKYHKTHPEWFALQPNGSRGPVPGMPFAPDRVQLCTSNQELIAVLAQDKIEEIEKKTFKPGVRKSVSISLNDGGYTTFCVCDKCKSLDPVDGPPIILKDWSVKPARSIEYVSLSDRMVRFYNQMTEKIIAKQPDVLITADIYSVYSRPPLKEKVHKGLLLRFSGISYASENVRERSLKDWDAWAAAGANMYWRPNLLWFGSQEAVPLNYSRKLAEDFKRTYERNNKATDFDSCINHWSTQGLNYYVLAKLHWQPDLNIDELIDDYCKSGFGDGWRDVRKYFDRIEKATNEISEKEKKVTEVYSPELINELRSYLENAKKNTPSKSKEAQRIDFLLMGLEFADLQARLYKYFYKSKGKNKIPLSKEERTKVTELLDKRMKIMQNILNESLMTINVVFCMGREGNSLRRMGNRNKSSHVPKRVQADENGRVIEE